MANERTNDRAQPAATADLYAARDGIDVFVVIEQGANERPYWHRVGSAFVNRDKSIAITLNSLPMSGRLVLRPRVPRDNPSNDGR